MPSPGPHRPAPCLCCASMCLSSLNSLEAPGDSSSACSGSGRSRSGRSAPGSPSSVSGKPCSSTCPMSGSGVSRLSEPSSLVCTSILMTMPSCAKHHGVGNKRRTGSLHLIGYQAWVALSWQNFGAIFSLDTCADGKQTDLGASLFAGAPRGSKLYCWLDFQELQERPEDRSGECPGW